jgi:DNA-binding PadR family transcriptional regulator
MDFNECACSGRSLARMLRPAVMGLLASGPAHGYQLARQLVEMKMFAAQEPDHAGLYRALKQMEDEGLLTSAWDLAETGPARRVFTITADGAACLGKWKKTLADYRDALDELLGLLKRHR